MQTISETAIFQKYAATVWTETERTEFINWIAANPHAGDVVPGSKGAEKFDGIEAAWANGVVPELCISTKFRDASGC